LPAHYSKTFVSSVGKTAERIILNRSSRTLLELN